MHYKLMFPSEYVGAHDLQGEDRDVTIQDVKIEELRLVGGIKQDKPVMSFSDAKKKMVLNKTNAATIAGLLGSETDEWRGWKITLYATTTKFGRDTVDCIRVRETKPEEQQS